VTGVGDGDRETRRGGDMERGRHGDKERAIQNNEFQKN